MEKIPFVIHPRSNENNMVGKKCFVYFLLVKYTPMSCKNGGQKWEWRYPTACVGTRQKYSDISNLFEKLQHAKAPES